MTLMLAWSHGLTRGCRSVELQIRRFLRISLPPRGYVTVEAASGQEALASSSAHCTDIILLDLALPNCDGIELTAQLRKITRAPIIVLSGHVHEPSKLAALDAGAWSHEASDSYLDGCGHAVLVLSEIRLEAGHHAARRA